MNPILEMIGGEHSGNASTEAKNRTLTRGG